MNINSSQSSNRDVPLVAKLAKESEIVLSQVIFPRDTNELGLATAGVVLKTVDVAAGLCAGKHSGRKVVTASLDRMDFIQPAKLWELVSTTCRMTKTWRSSMEVEVTVDAENTRNGERRHIALGYLTLVGLSNESLKPATVPPLLFESDEEIERAKQADIRRENRLQEYAEKDQRDGTGIDESDSPETVKRTMTPDDSNINCNVFGGVILEIIHQAGEKAAFLHANAPVIAVRQDRMNFEQPVYIGEEVNAKAVITRSWKSSMEVQVDVTAKDHKTDSQRKVASSYLVFIAQDLQGCPKPVPAFVPVTAKQQQRWNEAESRQRVRLQERCQSPG